MASKPLPKIPDASYRKMVEIHRRCEFEGIEVTCSGCQILERYEKEQGLTRPTGLSPEQYNEIHDDDDPGM